MPSGKNAVDRAAEIGHKPKRWDRHDRRDLDLRHRGLGALQVQGDRIGGAVDDLRFPGLQKDEPRLRETLAQMFAVKESPVKIIFLRLTAHDQPFGRDLYALPSR
jgi:hypothetical protein